MKNMDEMRDAMRTLQSEIGEYEDRIRSSIARSNGFRASNGRELLSPNIGGNPAWRITYFDENGEPSGHYEGGEELFREMAGRERLRAKGREL